MTCPTVEIPDSLPAGPYRLRAPVAADVDAIVTMCQDAEIARWTRVPDPYTEADAVEFVGLSAEQRRRGRGANFLIVDDDDVLLGSVGLSKIDAPCLEAEVGYYLAAGARGRGVATEAVRAVVDAGFAAGLQRIEALVLMGNEASRRLLDRIGFVEEGVLRSVAANGCGIGRDRTDLHVYSQIVADRVPA